MELTPEERAARALTAVRSAVERLLAEEGELQLTFALTINEALAEQRQSIEETLRLCVATFDEALVLEDAPRPFRALVRVCRGLCHDALGEGEEGEDGSEPGFPDPACPAERRQPPA